MGLNEGNLSPWVLTFLCNIGPEQGHALAKFAQRERVLSKKRISFVFCKYPRAQITPYSGPICIKAIIVYFYIAPVSMGTKRLTQASATIRMISTHKRGEEKNCFKERECSFSYWESSAKCVLFLRTK